MRWKFSSALCNTVTTFFYERCKWKDMQGTSFSLTSFFFFLICILKRNLCVRMQSPTCVTKFFIFRRCCCHIAFFFEKNAREREFLVLHHHDDDNAFVSREIMPIAAEVGLHGLKRIMHFTWERRESLLLWPWKKCVCLRVLHMYFMYLKSLFSLIRFRSHQKICNNCYVVCIGQFLPIVIRCHYPRDVVVGYFLSKKKMNKNARHCLFLTHDFTRFENIDEIYDFVQIYVEWKWFNAIKFLKLSICRHFD